MHRFRCHGQAMTAGGDVGNAFFGGQHGRIEIRGAGTGIARGFGTGHAISRMAGCFGVSFRLSSGVFFAVFFLRWFPSKGWSPSEGELAQDSLLPCFLRHFWTERMRGGDDGPGVPQC